MPSEKLKKEGLYLQRQKTGLLVLSRTKPRWPKPKSNMKTTKAVDLCGFPARCSMEFDRLALMTLFVIWTTTPWTLPANLAIAYNPDERYAFYRNRGDQVRNISWRRSYARISRKSTGMDLRLRASGRRYRICRLPKPIIHGSIASCRVLPADFVAMDTGTGLVHIAPGHGREDYALGLGA